MSAQFPDACLHVFKLSQPVDTPACSDAKQEAELADLPEGSPQTAFKDLPELFAPDGFPECTPSLPALRKEYESLVNTMGQSLKLYKPILDANITQTGSTEQLCAYKFRDLGNMYRQAKTDNGKIVDLNNRIREANQCFEQVGNWVDNVELTGLTEEGKLRDDTVRTSKHEFEKLSGARAELTYQLDQVEAAAPALLSLARLHRRVCQPTEEPT